MRKTNGCTFAKPPPPDLSVVNTKLRDYYSTLDVLCEDMQVDKQELIGKLEMIDYTYDAGSNQFV